MKKTYNKPFCKAIAIDETEIIALSDAGVAAGCSLGDEFNSEDVSYTKDVSRNLWDIEW